MLMGFFCYNPFNSLIFWHALAVNSVTFPAFFVGELGAFAQRMVLWAFRAKPKAQSYIANTISAADLHFVTLLVISRHPVRWWFVAMDAS